jgi:diguanylate cyclase (GGDEF)-like protein
MTVADPMSADAAGLPSRAGQGLADAERFARATLDAATGLPNRLLFDDRGRHALAQAERMGVGVGLLAIGCDFEDLVDTAGRPDDDTLRNRIGSALDGVLRKSDTVAALSDDLFVVLLAPTGAGFDSMTVARRFDALLARLALPAVRLRTAIGVARYPEDGESLAELLERAEQAMHRARRTGDRVALHEVRGALPPTTAAATAATTGRAALEWRYQPWFDARDGRAVGIEARWPGRRAVRDRPDDSLAWPRLCQALRQFQDFRAAGLTIEALGLRCEPALLDWPDLPLRLNTELAARQLDPRDLWLHVNAGHLVVATSEQLARLRALRDAGYGLVIDDFLGAADGLAALTAAPLDALRIGRSAVAALPVEHGGSSLRRRVVAAIGAAGNLNLDVIACGVDDEARRDLLTALGVRYLQGDALCLALTAADLRAAWPDIDGGRG